MYMCVYEPSPDITSKWFEMQTDTNLEKLFIVICRNDGRSVNDMCVGGDIKVRISYKLWTHGFNIITGYRCHGTNIAYMRCVGFQLSMQCRVRLDVLEMGKYMIYVV